ncbi:MAG: DUF1579 family protein [Vicinamibacterales bacterium]
MGAAGGKAMAKVVNRWILDGFAVVQEYEQRRDGQVNFRGHGVIWFDPAKQEYVMNWWDSMGGSGGAYRGAFDGNVLRLASPMPQGGHSQTTWAFGDGGYSFNMEISGDGQTWQPAMAGSYTRAAAKKAAAQASSKKAAPKKTAKAAAARTKPALRKGSGGVAMKKAAQKRKKR